MTIKRYTIGYDFGEVQYFDFTRWEARQTRLVWVFETAPYWETDKLHTYHPRKRGYSSAISGGVGLCALGSRRVKQVERWCKMAGREASA